METEKRPQEERTKAAELGELPQTRSVFSKRRNRLADDVATLANAIGPRNSIHYENLRKAESFVMEIFSSAGYRPVRQEYGVDGKAYANIIAEIPGQTRPQEVVVVGAHYDTHLDSPGANANASAVAALFELARYFRQTEPSRTLRFVAFTNEEKPFTRTEAMGSRIYARSCKKRGEDIVAMLCLESIGCYSQAEGSQSISLHGHLLPDRGDFIAIVGNRPSRMLLNRVLRSLSLNGRVAYQGVTLPSHIPGVLSSDHWAFWREKYPAVMVTDTGPLRYRSYHKRDDTFDKIDFEWLDRVVESLQQVLTDLVMPADLVATARGQQSKPRWIETPGVLGRRLFVAFAAAALALAGAWTVAKTRKEPAPAL